MDTNRRNVFLIHGRCEPLTQSVRNLLFAMDLKPREWNQLRLGMGSLTSTNLEIVQQGLASVHAVIVLLYGEERVAPIKELGGGKYLRQPRPNVIFEAGIALRLMPEKTLFVQVGDVRIWSDINRFILEDTERKRHELLLLLESIGCDVDRSNTNHLTRELDLRCIETS